VAEPIAGRVLERVGHARGIEAATRAPGPLGNPAAIESLAGVHAYGGTTLEEFDLCSYRWFVSHELDPQPLDPTPEPLVQGGLMHAALDRLYSDPPGPDPLPRPDSLAAWAERGRELVAEIRAEREIGDSPAEVAIARRVEALLARFLADEARRDAGGFLPWRLEATFDEREGAERPVLEIDGWALHGAIDRIDRAGDGRGVVIDYKVSGSVTPRAMFVERAKLQLQLYMLAAAEHWEVQPVAALYHPLRGTSSRRPRGVVLDEAAGDLATYDLYDNDVVDEARLEEELLLARERAGAIVARMRAGEIRRDPGPPAPIRGHDICPAFCEFGPICRRDRAPEVDEDSEREER
jgi:RecB family exonuclease